MGFEPMTNRVTDYYSTTELYSQKASKKISTIGLEPINPRRTVVFETTVSTNSTKWKKKEVLPTGIEPMLKDYESTVLPLNYGINTIYCIVNNPQDNET